MGGLVGRLCNRQWAKRQRDHGTMDNRPVDHGAMDNGTMEIGEQAKGTMHHGTVGFCETGTVGQSGAMGQWDIGQWDNGTMDK